MSFNTFDATGRPVYLERQDRLTCAPATSYWTERDQVGFTAWVAQHRQLAMRESKFGNPEHQVITDATIGEAAGTRLNRVKKQASAYQTLGMRI